MPKKARLSKWKSKMRNMEKFSLGDLVFAKVKGYVMWPARITRKATSYFAVDFFGTHETANVSADRLLDYAEHKAKLVTPFRLRCHAFRKAVAEIDAIIAYRKLAANVKNQNSANDAQKAIETANDKAKRSDEAEEPTTSAAAAAAAAAKCMTDKEKVVDVLIAENSETKNDALQQKSCSVAAAAAQK